MQPWRPGGSEEEKGGGQGPGEDTGRRGGDGRRRSGLGPGREGGGVAQTLQRGGMDGLAALGRVHAVGEEGMGWEGRDGLGGGAVGKDGMA